jgi:hypothetical protein
VVISTIPLERRIQQVIQIIYTLLTLFLGLIEVIQDVAPEIRMPLRCQVPNVFVVRVDLHYVLVVPVSDSDAPEELVQTGTARRI